MCVCACMRAYVRVFVSVVSTIIYIIGRYTWDFSYIIIIVRTSGIVWPPFFFLRRALCTVQSSCTVLFRCARPTHALHASSYRSGTRTHKRHVVCVRVCVHACVRAFVSVVSTIIYIIGRAKRAPHGRYIWDFSYIIIYYYHTYVGVCVTPFFFFLRRALCAVQSSCTVLFRCARPTHALHASSYYTNTPLKARQHA